MTHARATVYLMPKNVARNTSIHQLIHISFIWWRGKQMVDSFAIQISNVLERAFQFGYDNTRKNLIIINDNIHQIINPGI